jgi:hypothetical protein
MDLSASSSREVAATEWQRFSAPKEFKEAVAGVVTPGTTIIVTADSLDAGSTGESVTILEDAPAAG